ncbi:MAG: SH3 domain-containing protein [Clostridia bacterium]|nr:SH3 domain-containing protein [Clostridia bacterium]
MKGFRRIAVAALLACLLTVGTFTCALPSLAAAVKGDLTGDGKVTEADAAKLLKIVSSKTAPTAAQLSAGDFNGDGKLDLRDVTQLYSKATASTTEVFQANMRELGFPASYIPYLTTLHIQHPKWVFEPFITGLVWDDAVKGERTPHRKQLILTSQGASMQCSCSSCKGVIQEGPSWVSASEKAVKYYMDPRNWLDEEHIFQFEDCTYASTQTIAGVNAILKGTWMYNANITYLDAFGKTQSVTKNDKAVTYAAAILEAAKTYDVSAYYIASKIKQEVGSSSASNAGGSCGDDAPFLGIYNYYNIGAYTGARDGLEWANGYMTTKVACPLYSKAATTATKLGTVAKGSEIYYIGATGNFYRVRAVTDNGKTQAGYILKSGVSMYTTYGRPWTNPYKSIVYGAQYVHDNFMEYQFTNYLQKFNVNPASESLHYHEYMGNVMGAASEASMTYDAYSELGILDSPMTFSIPVYKNMPSDDWVSEFAATAPTLARSGATTTTVSFKWNLIDHAEGYRLYKYNSSTDKYTCVVDADAATTSCTVTLKSGELGQFKLHAYYYNAEKKRVFTAASKILYVEPAPAAVTGLKVTAYTSSSVTLNWTATDCDAYFVYRSPGVGGKTNLGSTTSTTFTDQLAEAGTKYTYHVVAYNMRNSSVTKTLGASSNKVSVTTKGTAAATLGTGTVYNAGTLNVRKGPDTTYDVVTMVYDGQVLTLLGTAGSGGTWYHVKFTKNSTSYEGYVFGEYVKKL